MPRSRLPLRPRSADDFAQRSEFPEEVHVYSWLDATLSEVAELVQQQTRSKLVTKRLEANKAAWFSETGSESAAESMNQFLQHCIFPRCVFTPSDAVYCAKFVALTHAQGTPYFSTLQYYDKLLRDISVHIFCCTEHRRPIWAAS